MAGLQPGVDLRPRADAAAELHRRIGGFQDRLDRRAVHRLALEGAVQVNHVKMGEAGLAEGFGLRRRAVGEDGRLVHLAAQEAHALAVFQVDGGVEGKGHACTQGAHCRKLERILRPVFWLFSGWNCVPNMLRRATAATIGWP